MLALEAKNPNIAYPSFIGQLLVLQKAVMFLSGVDSY